MMGRAHFIMVDKKKMLFVVEAFGGGVFTYIVELANALVDEFEVHIAYSVREQTPDDFKSYFKDDIKLIEVQNFCREINPVKDIKALKELKEIEKRIKPDIIHLHSSKAGVLGRILFGFGKVPVFYTPHGYSFLMEDQSALKVAVFKAIERVCGFTKCMTISCSEGEHRETLKLTKKAQYVSNGINIQEVQAIIDEVEKKDHPFTVFTLGRICYQKNPALFNEIAENMPDTKFIWIGDGELRDELNSSNIAIAGWLDRKSAIEIAVNADVFVLTSLWEGLPISLLEAMYMGKKCVVSDVIGNNDVIKNGVNGWVCKSNAEFVNAIKNTGFAVVENARKDVLDNYNVDVMVEKYRGIYKNPIGC